MEMLPASYFNGERLRMYLSILEEFKKEQNDMVYKDVEQNPVIVVSVQETKGEVLTREEIRAPLIESVTALAVIDDRGEQGELEMDFSVSSAPEFMLDVCETKREVNRVDRFGSEYYRYNLKKMVNIVVRNGQWSKEFRADYVNLLIVSRRSEHRREIYCPDLYRMEDDIKVLDEMFARTVSEDVLLEYRYLPSNFEFENGREYWMLPYYDKVNKVVIIIRKEKFIVVYGKGHYLVHSRDIKICGNHMMQALQMSDGRFMLVDYYDVGMRYGDRRKEMKQIVSEMNKANDLFVTLIDAVLLRTNMKPNMIPGKGKGILLEDNVINWNGKKWLHRAPYGVVLYLEDNRLYQYDGNMIFVGINLSKCKTEGSWKCEFYGDRWHLREYIGKEKIREDSFLTYYAGLANFSVEQLLFKFNKRLGRKKRSRDKN